jgi:ribosomal protein L37AE/L43A
MSFTEKLQEGIAKWFVEIAIATATALVVLIADFIVPDSVLEAIGRVASGRIVLGLVMIVIIVSGTLFYLWPRLRFDRGSGSYVDKKGTHYCPVCLVDRRKRMPMLEAESGWWCFKCKQAYGNPNYKAPPPTAPIRAVRRSWLWGDRPY